MQINLPEGLGGGKFAGGCRISNAPEVVTLDFIAQVEGDEYVVVERIRLAPSALEPLYLELGGVLQGRRDG